MNSFPIWKFKQKNPEDRSIDPIQDAFFESEESGGYNDALIREIIQNSLDAKDSKFLSGPVTVKITLYTKQNKIKATQFHPYIKDLIPHLHAEKNGLSACPDFEDDIPYILIADYGTTGLEGDPRESNEEDNLGKPHNFYYFWRNVGRSDKNADERGRWGIGKAVYMRSSAINTYFGLTVRASDNKFLLLGQSVLKEHTLNETKFIPYGDFGLFEEEEGRKYFPLPENREQYIQQFQEIFRTDRSKTDSGLSLVIPYPDPEITADGLAWAAIAQYFHPVMTGELCIEITEGINTITINKEMVNSEISKLNYNRSKYTENNLRKLIYFTEWAVSHPENTFTYLKEQELAKMPVWSDDLLDAEILPELREKFEKGKSLAFKVPVKVHAKGKYPKTGWFSVYLSRDTDLKSTDVHYIRQGITITSEAQIRDKGIRALVVIDTDPLSTMLGDAENVAHTKWDKLNPRFRNHYEHGPTCLNFVKNSVREIIRILSVPPEGLDTDLLAGVFSVSNPDDPSAPLKKSKRNRKKRGKGSTPNVPKIPQGTRKMIEIVKIKNGFTMKKYPDAEYPPVSVDVRLAYDVASGDPFKKYRVADFNLSNLQESGILIVHSSATVTDRNENRLSFIISHPDFYLSVSGFDEHRDLIIDAKPKRRET